MLNALERLRELRSRQATNAQAADYPAVAPAPLAASPLATDHAGHAEFAALARLKIEAAGVSDRMRAIETPAAVLERIAAVSDIPLCPIKSAILSYLFYQAPASFAALVKCAKDAGAFESRARQVVHDMQARGLIGFDIQPPTGYRLGHEFLEARESSESD